MPRGTRAKGPGYLGLSNTLIMAGRLSFSKPPHRQDSFAVLFLITDGIPSLEPGSMELRIPSGIRPHSLFRSVPSEGPVYRP